MELTINIKMDERFAAAVEVLSAAIATYAKAYEKVNDYLNDRDCGPHPGELKAEPTEVVEEITPTVVEAAPVAAVATLTRAELQAKAARLMQIERGKYALDLKGALTECGAANITSLDESMFEKFNSLMADLWEVAA